MTQWKMCLVNAVCLSVRLSVCPLPAPHFSGPVAFNPILSVTTNSVLIQQVLLLCDGCHWN